MIKKLIVLLLVLVIMAIGVWGCTTQKAQDAAASKSDKLKVVTSFFTLADFTQKVGGPYVEVTNLMPAGADHHEFQPSLQQRATLEAADLLIVNGLGMEQWLEDIKQSLGEDGPTIITVGESIEKEKLIDGDAHVWLDPALAAVEVRRITQALVEADSEHRQFYLDNQDEYLKQLESLDLWAKSVFDVAKGKSVVVSHGAFGYLTRAYGLKQVPILGLASEVEPNPQQLADLIDICRDQKITHIYMDEQERSRAAETIAKEVGAIKLPLYSGTVISEEQRSQGIGYLELMRTNLENISESMGGKN